MLVQGGSFPIIITFSAIVVHFACKNGEFDTVKCILACTYIGVIVETTFLSFIVVIFCCPPKYKIIEIQFMFLGINIFWALP